MSESFSSTVDNVMNAAIERAEKAEAENKELKDFIRWVWELAPKGMTEHQLRECLVIIGEDEE